jgi:hypothetical protein
VPPHIIYPTYPTCPCPYCAKRGLEGEGIRRIRGIRRRGRERYLTGSQASKGEGSLFLEWFARVRKYFVRNKKFRSEISRFQEGLKVLEKVLKLKGFNLKVKLKLKCLKGVPEGGIPEGGVPESKVVFDRLPKVRDRRFRIEGYSSGL